MPAFVYPYSAFKTILHISVKLLLSFKGLIPGETFDEKKLTAEELALIAGSTRNDGEEVDDPPPIVVTGSPPPPIVVTGSPPPPIVVTGSPPPPIVVTGGPPPPPPSGNPYSPDFDCAVANPEQKRERNLLHAMAIATFRVSQEGFGTGPGSGYNFIEYGSFVYETSPGNFVASQPITTYDPRAIAFEWGSSTPGGPPDLVVGGGQSIPISSIVGFVHNHPSNSALSVEEQASYPLPSAGNGRIAPDGTPVTGDYEFGQALIDFNAAADLLIGIFAEETKDGGYKLRPYRVGSVPPTAYGPVIPLDIAPCP